MAYAADIGKLAIETTQNARQARQDAYASGRNAEEAAKAASIRRQEGYAAEEAQRREARKALGSAFTSMAQNGGGFDDLLMKDMSREAEVDAMNIAYNTEMDGRDYDAQVAQFQFDKRAYARKARAWAIGGHGAGAVEALQSVADYKTQRARERLNEAGREPKNIQNTVIKSNTAGAKAGLKTSKTPSWQDSGLNWNSSGSSSGGKWGKTSSGKGKGR